jgi:hypothetical protein
LSPFSSFDIVLKGCKCIFTKCIDEGDISVLVDGIFIGFGGGLECTVAALAGGGSTVEDAGVGWMEECREEKQDESGY